MCRSLTLLAFLSFVCILPAGCFLSSGIPDINIIELKKLMERDAGVLVVDNRTTMEYTSGHIPGAIHIPQEEFFRIASYLPKEKDAIIVFYCRGHG